ncbi:ABC-2 type transport system permease protein [Dysgonomonas sp. PH5-45]|uniref:ABC transporter permease n=1 Tax=unclassified Dysgonomonas TaxID=2630389 RepID=UPI0024768B29|nr:MULTISPECIES: ABC transporter permease [unclassified Dysgonomonas]MDH6353823.1 ABC-2 type transport system permease protein [Dysgonomonas sp. PH5-45]MDH6386725.1 ABC-2 type transport system permease protein [Dysgonomonas sp. PH5-37]
MKALPLIIQREYTTRVKKKSFILSTILTPVIFIGIIVGSIFMAGIKDSDVKRIVVIDTTGKYGQHLTSDDSYNYELAHEQSEDAKSKIGDEIFGVLQITDDLAKNPNGATFFSEKQPPMELISAMQRTFGDEIKKEKLAVLAQEQNVDLATIQSVQEIEASSNKLQISTIRFDQNGEEKETSSMVASVIGVACTMLMYIFIISYGAMVMQGVIEEKSNRIVEVMVSSVKPFDLMMGKILGISLVGLTQLAIWGVLIAGFSTIGSSFLMSSASVDTVNMAQMGSMDNMNEMADAMTMLSSINWVEILVMFFLFFIGGYLMYAALFAMFGSAVDNVQDSQQFVMPITLIFLFALYAGMYSINNPDGPLAFWCSMIPLTSPVVMMVRVPFGVPLWEELVSVGILFVSTILIVMLSAKVYRVGILMYGKKPSLKELAKWMRYK